LESTDSGGGYSMVLVRPYCCRSLPSTQWKEVRLPMTILDSHHLYG